MSTFRRVRAVLGSLAAVAVICLAAPGALALIAALAWPQGPWSGAGSARFAVLGVDAVGLVAWLLFVSGMVADVARRVRRRDLRAGLGLRDRAAVALAGLVLLVLPATLLAGTSGAAPLRPRAAATAPASPSVTAPVSGVGAQATVSVPAPASTSPPASPAANAVDTVQPGDCLSTIAEQVYGTESMWQEIWSANAGDLMDDGERFTDPNFILPGWQLVLPGIPAVTPTAAPATSPAPAASPAPATAPAGSSASTPATGVSPATTVRPRLGLSRPATGR